MARTGSRTWSRTAGATAWVLVTGRWLVVAGWVAAAGAAWLLLPGLGTSGGGLGDVTSKDNPALVAEAQAAQDFGVPLLSRLVVVQHDPAGLPDDVLRRSVGTAVALVDQGTVGRDTGAAVSEATRARIAAAVPVPSDERVPGVRSPGTTVVTFLYPRPDQGFAGAMEGARSYAADLGGSAAKVVGVTGSLPARDAQTRIVTSSLPLLEAASLAAVLLVVAVAFRSLVAPLLTLAVSGVAYVLVTRVSGALGDRYGWDVPADLEPLMVALLLGIVTDYVVYFLSGLRTELAEGQGRVDAARRTTAVFAPIVLVAGITVTVGVLTLRLASSPPVQVFGPAMAVTVLVTLAVSVTLVPALMGILGRVCLWPSDPARAARRSLAVLLRQGTVRVVRTKVGALVVAAGCIAGLVAVALPAAGLRSGLPFVASLPADHEVRRAAAAAAEGFAPGITSPTLVELRAPSGRSLAPDGLDRLQTALRAERHVAAVIGPREDALVSGLAGRTPGLFVRTDGSAAQYLVVLDVDPLDADAVAAVQRLELRLPALVRDAGLPAGTRAGVGGDSAAVAAIVAQTERDLLVIVLAALAVNLLLLIVFLRALVAPLFLLGCTVLSAAATFGLTALVFQTELGHPGVTFFVPLAAGVLLLALGSDYNLFAVGHVWAHARRLPLKDAMLAALPQSSGAITTAGVALAASLGTLALVPLRQFRELAFALVVGILVDALVVRTLLAPALLALVGTASGWPGRRLRRRPVPDHAVDVAPVGPASEVVPPDRAGRTTSEAGEAVAQDRPSTVARSSRTASRVARAWARAAGRSSPSTGTTASR